MKRIILLTMLITTCMMPVAVQANDNIETEVVTTAQFEEVLHNVTDTRTMYTTTEVNIRKEPNTEADIIDTSRVNTAFEIVAEINGWAMITTEDGYAYMKADWFSEVPVKVNAYSDEDLEILTRILTGECHTYPDDEQLMVGSVFLNRVNHSRFPDTFEGVAFQKGQYACTWDGNYYRKPTDRNRTNAKWLLENGSILPPDVVYQSGGNQGSSVYKRTKYHYFCYY